MSTPLWNQTETTCYVEAHILIDGTITYGVQNSSANTTVDAAVSVSPVPPAVMLNTATCMIESQNIAPAD